MKEASSCPELPPIPSSPRLPFWRRLKALFRLYLMSLVWLSFNPRVGSRSAPPRPPPILALVQAPLWLCFGVAFIVAAIQQSLSLPPFSVPPPPPPTTPHPPLSVSAPQVAGLLPGTQISGRSRLRPFVWGGILPLFSHLACNLNTQNISCLTNRPRDKGAAEDKRLEAVQPHAGLMVSDWA